MDEDEVHMDQEVAKKLLVEGATLIILNLPPGTEFGIDLKSWHTGNKFKGVKMIPPGLHMFYYNISNKYGDVAPRVSYTHNFKKSEIIVKKYNIDLEELIAEEPSEDEISRLKSNLFNLDEYLGPYPYEILDKWKSLSKNISEKLINRITPECGIIRSALDYYAEQPVEVSSHSGETSIQPSGSPQSAKVILNTSNSDKKSEGESSCELNDSEVTSNPKLEGLPRRKRKSVEAGLLPDLKPTPGTQLRFTCVPNDLFPQDSTPSDITKHSIDPTFTLETLLSSMDNEMEYIGEIELSFVCFLVGLSLDSLEAWKRLVILACRCQQAVSQRPNFYSALLSSLHSQLQHIPEDFLVDIVESENAIYMSLRDLFRSILTGDRVNQKLKKIATACCQKLSEKFGWDFTNLEEDDEDEAPVIVDLGDAI